MLLALASAPAAAAPNYGVTLDNYSVNAATAVRRASTTVSGATTRTSSGMAAPGMLGLACETRTDFDGPGSDVGSNFVQCTAFTDDFVISGGPGPSVTASLHFRSTIALGVEGGYAGHSGHAANVSMSVGSYGYGVSGSRTLSNGSAEASGVYTAVGAEGGEVAFSITGTFPVGVPFGVNMSLQSSTSTYGNGSVAPGIAGCTAGGGDLGLAVGDFGGRVMDLPAGYTVNSPSWGVSDNQIVPVADAGGAHPERFALGPVTPNPSASRSIIALALARAADVEVTLHDLQGRAVRTLASGARAAGRHELAWDGRDDAGRAVAAGVYLAIAHHDGERHVRRVVRMR